MNVRICNSVNLVLESRLCYCLLAVLGPQQKWIIATGNCEKLYHNYYIQTWSQVQYVLKGLNENIKTVASFHGLSCSFFVGSLFPSLSLLYTFNHLRYSFLTFLVELCSVSKLFLGNNAHIHVSYLALTFTGKVICIVFICITKLLELCGKYVELPFLELLVVNYIRLVAIYIG